MDIKKCLTCLIFLIFSISVLIWFIYFYSIPRPAIKSVVDDKWLQYIEMLQKESNEELELNDLDMFIKACVQGDVTEVKMYIDSGMDINEKNDVGYTSVLACVNARQKDVLELLLENGAEADVNDPYGRKPLHTAVVLGPIDIVELLLKHGASVNSEGPDGWTPLHTAIRSRTPSYAKKDYDRLAIVKTLIKYGADVNARNNKGDLWESEHDSAPLGREIPPKGKTPLEIAENLGYDEIVKILIQNGAK